MNDEISDAMTIMELARNLAGQDQATSDRANQRKSRYLTAASHDLRRPLRAMALLNASLRSLVSDPEANAALSQQEQTIAALSRLVNALLDISKLDSGAIKPEPADFTLAALFEELRKEFAVLASNKGIELRIDQSCDGVHSDPSLVERILRNLLANAIKYTKQGRVALRCLHETAFVRIEVLDTGIGIPADHLPHIYDEFYQVGDPRGGPREGYGLGLSIVQRVAKLLNVTLDVRSEVGKGSAFSLILPAMHGQTATAPCALDHSPMDAMAKRGNHVLLVEDEPSVRSALRMLLKVEGYQVTAAATRTEALQRVAERECADVLVTDYHLDNHETGLQVIEALREALDTLLPAILLTGDTSSAMRDLPADPRRWLVSKPANADVRPEQ